MYTRDAQPGPQMRYIQPLQQVKKYKKLLVNDDYFRMNLNFIKH